MHRYASRSKIFSQPPGAVSGSTMSVRTVDVRPGDYLPPQACLDPTDWQDSGFPVGPAPGDVCLDYPRPGRVLLFGELGIMDSLTKHLVVTVIRPDTGAAPPA